MARRRDPRKELEQTEDLAYVARFYANRTLEIQGRSYERDEEIDAEGLSSRKLAQLVDLRVLRIEGGELMPPLTATRSFSVGDRKFDRGDIVPDGLLPVHKRQQLLEQRYLQPAT
jgi:hypothetical protein